MNTIDIARKFAAMGSAEDAIKAYTLALGQGAEPAGRLEAAAYILQNGGNYQISYTAFIELYNQGHFREDILPLMIRAFYEPNVKALQKRYERNCRLLRKYPYFFRKDFIPFEDLPFCFFPYDGEDGYVPFYPEEERFGEYINFKNTVISKNFFRDLEKPILADDVYSQYELEYLNDNVRRSEDVGRENHVYLHYTDWGAFCAHLQCLNFRPLLESKKLVFLIGDEVEQYPIDFKERFGVDYSQYPVRPVRVSEINRLIWHVQFSTHNGGDFFNEVFDSHPNLLILPSVALSNIEECVEKISRGLDGVGSLEMALEGLAVWNKPYLVEELYRMKGRTPKDTMVALFLAEQLANSGLDPASRIAPAVLFQPHFNNMAYSLRVNERNDAILESENYELIRKSPFFQGFKYIKSFTPLRRSTTSHGATVRFMYQSALESREHPEEPAAVVSDAVSERVLNRSFMIDPEDRLYRDSVLVRFEDGKLNPKATFSALAAFLDLPYTESMTYCSMGGVVNPHPETKGFDPAPVYKTYDDYANDAERYYIEYFLRDAYEHYGYSFHYYDGGLVDEEKALALVKGFTTVNHYMRESWWRVFQTAEVSKNGERVDAEVEKTVQEHLFNGYMETFEENRIKNTKILLEGLRLVNPAGQPLRFMQKLEPDPALLEQPLYH